MTGGEGLRARRVAEGVRAHVTRALLREIGDRRLSDVVVTGVEMPDDLQIASIGVRRLADIDEKGRRELLRALEGATSRLRRGLGAALGLKRTPALRFRYDSAPDALRRVEELLSEIADERRGGEGS
jgi:ribosome-binding factor A